METKQLIADVLDTSAKVLIDKGWVQNYFERDNQYCALGAVDKALYEMGYGKGWVYIILYAGSKEALLDVIGPNTFASVSGWNDDPDRTLDEVLQAFRDAAIKVRPDAMTSGQSPLL